MKTLLYLAAIAGMITLPRCAKINNVSPVDTIALKNFPVEAGNYWVYKVTNFKKNTVDTVTVSVAGRRKSSNGTGPIAILQVKWPDKMDTQYISIIADTVRVYADSNETDIMNAFIFPLQINHNPSFQLNPQTFGNLASVQVLLSLDTTVDQDYKNHPVRVYRIEKRFLPYAFTPIREFYAVVDSFAPAVGIVKEDREYITGPATNEKRDMIETWELMDVHLNGPVQ